MFELEIKIKLDNVKETKQKLQEMGAEPLCLINHTDSYYNAPKGLRNFKETDEALRLRTSIVKDFTSKKTITKEHDLTYKGPKIDDVVKSRIEHVAKILDVDKMDEILQELGFIKLISLEKERRAYSLPFQEKKIEILVDKVQYLDGYYLEAELMAEEKSEMEKIRPILLDFLTKLGYSEDDPILESYLELVFNVLSSRKKRKIKKKRHKETD